MLNPNYGKYFTKCGKKWLRDESEWRKSQSNRVGKKPLSNGCLALGASRSFSPLAEQRAHHQVATLSRAALTPKPCPKSPSCSICDKFTKSFSRSRYCRAATRGTFSAQSFGCFRSHARVWLTFIFWQDQCESATLSGWEGNGYWTIWHPFLLENSFGGKFGLLKKFFRQGMFR